MLNWRRKYATKEQEPFTTEFGSVNSVDYYKFCLDTDKHLKALLF